MQLPANIIDNPFDRNGISYKELPSNLTTYAHQIGGYNPDHKDKFKFLYGTSDSTLYKVVSPHPKGLNEVKLYENVFSQSCITSLLQELRTFLPRYRGLFCNAVTNRFFIGMEDILLGMKNPSACDIKMGKTTSLPDDCPAKIVKEKAKYRWREKIGFFITGINVFDAEAHTDTFFDISYGRSLGPSTIFEKGICLFLGKDCSRRVCLAHAFLVPLTKLENWFESQDLFYFCASSLLLAYDSTDDSTSPNVRVRLIDFTRWRALSSQKDVNFLVGLHRLIALFRKILPKDSSDNQEHLATFSCNNSSYENKSFTLSSNSPRESVRPLV